MRFDATRLGKSDLKSPATFRVALRCIDMPHVALYFRAFQFDALEPKRLGKSVDLPRNFDLHFNSFRLGATPFSKTT